MIIKYRNKCVISGWGATQLIESLTSIQRDLELISINTYENYNNRYLFFQPMGN